MDKTQVIAAFERMEGIENAQARLWLDAADSDGTVSIIVNAGEYELLKDERMLVTRYDYTDDDVYADFRWRDARRHAGTNCIPFGSIKLITVFERGME